MYRDLAGSEVVEKCIDRALTIRELINIIAPRVLKAIQHGVPYIVLVDGEAKSLNDVLDKDCEIAILPPPSGGSNDVSAEFFDGDLDLSLLRELARRYGPLGAGALAVFIGFVKGIVENRNVIELVYEVYEPYGSQKLRELAYEASKRSGILAVHIKHRKGAAKPGDITLLIAVVGKSRSVAIDTLTWLLERIKHEVPVFKLERREDGEFWVVGDGKRIPRKDVESLSS